MTSLGIAIKKGELVFSLLKGNKKSDAEILVVDKRNFQAEQDICELMSTFYNLFCEIISKHKPDKIACKISLDAKKDQIAYLHCSLGVLAYICKQERINLTLRNNSWITSPKRKKLIECENHFLSFSLKNEKLFSVLVAWNEFEV